MKPFKRVPFFLLSLIIVGCASYPDVRPGSGGLNRVRVVAGEKELAERSALRQATAYCAESKKRVAIQSEDTKYSGTLDETDNAILRKASKVVGVLGGTTAVMGGERESNAGKVGAGVGAAGSIMTDNGYTAEMTFKCE